MRGLLRPNSKSTPSSPLVCNPLISSLCFLASPQPTLRPPTVPTMHPAAVLALLAAAAAPALADSLCGTIQPNSKSAPYGTAVRAHTVAPASTAKCPDGFNIGAKYGAWCCPPGNSINEV